MYPIFNPKKLNQKQLIALVLRINQVYEKANNNCGEPGISIGEAVYREFLDKKHILFVNHLDP